MSDEDETCPLLSDDDAYIDNNIKAINSKPLSIFTSKNNIKCEEVPDISFSDVDPSEKAEPDIVIAAFVIAFDTKCGNIIEWNTPQDVNLEKVEFKAMPSGAHTVENDFIYFRLNNYFGLSYYAKMKVDSFIERGARMKSVGLLSLSYTTLNKHMQFLENQVRHQLQTPGNFQALKEFFNDRQMSLPAISTQTQSVKTDSVPHMQITHPAGCFSQFMQFFGEKIFVLWKLVLLQKRILFFSHPPIGVVCYRVYCACCLGKITLEGFQHKSPKPLFYINIADIDSLETELSYIACTTESIFQEKTHLYDIYVNNQNVTATTHHNEAILKINQFDKERFYNFVNHRSDLNYEQCIGVDCLPTDEHVCQSYFTRLNNQLFHTLLEVSASYDRTLTEDHVRAMGLDPKNDRQFIMDLLELYAIDVVFLVDNPCCPI